MSDTVPSRRYPSRQRLMFPTTNGVSSSSSQTDPVDQPIDMEHPKRDAIVREKSLND